MTTTQANLSFAQFANMKSQAKSPPLNRWLAFWSLGLLGIGVSLILLTQFFGWPVVSWRIVDFHSLIRVWLVAALLLCGQGIMYCIARINDQAPGHDRSTSNFLDFIGYLCLITAIVLAFNAIYVTAWRLPFSGWGPEVLWFDSNTQQISNPIVAVAFSADESSFLARHENGELQSWNWHGNQLHRKHHALEPLATSSGRDTPFVAPDGRRRLAITGIDGRTLLEVRDHLNDSLIHTYTYKPPVHALKTQVVFSSDGKFALVSLDHAICLLRLP